ncbi:MAG: helix-turn-helix domain-containing protein [Gaiellales bacterium]|nr:helix-turn-helix domain-containing protein [Gaiellales bacterium]
MIEIGNSLREARNRQGLSIRDAEDATKIRSKYLQAMEQDDFEVLPGPTFVMGFLRTYAAYLGLDADAVVEEYRNAYAPHVLDAHRLPNAPLRSRPRQTGPRRSNYVVVAVIALVVIIILAWVGWGNRRTGDTVTTVSRTTITATTGASGTDRVAGASAQDSPSGTGSASVAEQGEAVAAVDGEGLAVAVEAVRDCCYLVVREGSSGGKTLYSQTLEEGESVSFEGENVLWMTIANPTAVILNINGREFNVPDPYGDFEVTASGLERLRS